MEKNNIVRKFIVENFLFGESDNIKDTTDMFKESIIDSTGILELISFIEMTYGIRIEDNEMVQENFNTISSINKFLKTKTVNKTNNHVWISGHI